jgi:hypothetical protein
MKIVDLSAKGDGHGPHGSCDPIMNKVGGKGTWEVLHPLPCTTYVPVVLSPRERQHDWIPHCLIGTTR